MGQLTPIWGIFVNLLWFFKQKFVNSPTFSHPFEAHPLNNFWIRPWIGVARKLRHALGWRGRIQFKYNIFVFFENLLKLGEVVLKLAKTSYSFHVKVSLVLLDVHPEIIWFSFLIYLKSLKQDWKKINSGFTSKKIHQTLNNPAYYSFHKIIDMSSFRSHCLWKSHSCCSYRISHIISLPKNFSI